MLCDRAQPAEARVKALEQASRIVVDQADNNEGRVHVNAIEALRDVLPGEAVTI